MAQDGAATKRRAARLATLGTLARPVQHEVNNLLTVVFANLEMLKRSAAEGAPQRQLGRIQEAAKRFETTTRAMLSLLRRPVEAEPVTLRLTELVEALRPLLLLLLPAPGALRLALEAEDAPLPLDRTALEEALLTLAVEVAEALPPGAGLGLEVVALPGATELRLSLPLGLAPPALQRLTALVRAAGGEAEAVEDGWRLSFPLAVP
ncbi:histidine kinase dimerization/phospho-acceptor domain-containing protein [Siccirubricoccus phaeus]|uniref:histidine kinase dimerization/phospho-acceptor domain-containing protein n=1 Tax=Siccirubricoccus phaeus TaxID=2595053 RepID=UPI0011F2C34F|nr:histidine kinase dimerization/phospho-acceptor domain-containing protein [Siccirubricoccus phaeus]